MFTIAEGRVSSPLALEKFTDACSIQHSPHHHIMAVPTYQIGTSSMKAGAHSYGCLFARSIYQYWEWDFCTSFAVPFSIQRILPPDVPSLHASDGCIKEHDCWNSLSLYFHNPDNKMVCRLHSNSIFLLLTVSVLYFTIAQSFDPFCISLACLPVKSLEMLCSWVLASHPPFASEI